MWFETQHLQRHQPVVTEDMLGVALPHAGTAHCGHVLSHTLRFRPRVVPLKFVLLYLPAQRTPDADSEAPTWLAPQHRHHEVVVPLLAMLHLWPSTVKASWTFYDVSRDIPRGMTGTFVVVSSDWSHFRQFSAVRHAEDAAASALTHGSFIRPDIVDSLPAFRFGTLPHTSWQWVGRSRSVGMRGVGYLSFLLRRDPVSLRGTVGFFVTGYGPSFQARECLGEYEDVTLRGLRTLVQKVRRLAATQSPRLSPHAKAIDARDVNMVVSLLYPSKLTQFIRGWHTVRACGATYLSNVFLEHTHESGIWMDATYDTWVPPYHQLQFDMKHTLKQLMLKAGAHVCNGQVSLLDTRTFPVRSSGTRRFG